MISTMPDTPDGAIAIPTTRRKTKKNSVDENENENERTPTYTQGKESNKKNSSADNSRTTIQSKEGKRG